MSWKLRIVAFAFAVVFAAAPLSAIAASDCGTCCCPPADCHESAKGCDAVLGSGACCDEAPPATPSVTERTPPAPTLQAVPAFREAFASPEPDFRSRARDADLDVRISPLRLSVVLRI